MKEVRNFNDLKEFLARKKLEREQKQANMHGAIAASNHTTSRISSNTLSVQTERAADVRTEWDTAKPNLGGSNCVTGDRGFK